MPKRRLYDPIIVEEQYERGQNKVAVTTNIQSPTAINTTKNTTRTSSRKTRRNYHTNDSVSNHNARQCSGNRRHPITPAVSSRPATKKNPHRRSSQILVKLSNACQSHQKDFHLSNNNDGHANAAAVVNNNRAHRTGAIETDIPASCQSALSKLESLLPKLQREIPFKYAWREVASNIDANEEEYAAILDDVLLLCDFYGSILSGYYCPHMPQLFHWGKHIGSSKFCERDGCYRLSLSVTQIQSLPSPFFAMNISFELCPISAISSS
jgi:hypothetical protein